MPSPTGNAFATLEAASYLPYAAAMSASVPSEDAQTPRSQFFRANVGIAVLDAAGDVLALERYGHAGSWQMPQGGLDVGEEPVDAARRELKEETGLRWDQVQLLGEHPDWLAYELDADMRKPDTGRGQVQKWFYVRLVDPQARIQLGRVDERKGTPEFTAHAWMSFGDLLDKAVAFRRGVYRRVAEHARTLGGGTDDSPSYRRLLLGGSSRVASHRLTASIENYEADLEYRLDRHPELRGGAWEAAVRRQLETVRAHQRRGEIDTAWRCFNLAARRELDVASEAELLTRAKALRREGTSAKLAAAWRADLIGELLASEQIEEQLPKNIEDVRWRLTEATRHRDEDADNRYYKVALVRGQRSLLLLVLLVCIAIVLGLAAAVDWDGDLGDPPVGFVALVAVFGALGACLSAIQSLGRAAAHGRIPEHVASSLVTITRPALGAAAALGVYAIAASGLLNISLEGNEAHLTVLALAFAAGFSERLVLSAVGTATGSTQKT
jgi:putative (di)nucleoside polyphosphate hydrolase